MTSEAINWLKRGKRVGAILKLYFHKAYDSVDWSFLLFIMQQMGFSEMWCSWIWECVYTASMSVIINGSPTKPFKIGRGLRQGDPLSSFLFVVGVEVLHKLLAWAEN